MYLCWQGSRMHVGISSLAFLVTLMTCVQAVNPISNLKRCHDWKFRSKDCPQWHFCHPSRSLCTPCQVCHGQSENHHPSGNCKYPVYCTSGTHFKVCQLLYPGPHANTSIDYFSNKPYLGTQAATSCEVNGTQYTESLMCGMADERPTWQGDMTCVTLIKPQLNGFPKNSTVAEPQEVVKLKPETKHSLKYIVGVSSALVCIFTVAVVVSFLWILRIKRRRLQHQNNSEYEVQPQDFLSKTTEKAFSGLTSVPCSSLPDVDDGKVAVEHDCLLRSYQEEGEPDPPQDTDDAHSQVSVAVSYPIQESGNNTECPVNEENKHSSVQNEETVPKISYNLEQREDIEDRGMDLFQVLPRSRSPIQHSLTELSSSSMYSTEYEPNSSFSLETQPTPSTSITSGTKQSDSSHPFRDETAPKIRITSNLPTENSYCTSPSSDWSRRYSGLPFSDTDPYLDRSNRNNDTSYSPISNIVSRGDNITYRLQETNQLLRGPSSEHLQPRWSSGCFGASSSSQSEPEPHHMREAGLSGDSGITHFSEQSLNGRQDPTEQEGYPPDNYD